MATNTTSPSLIVIDAPCFSIPFVLASDIVSANSRSADSPTICAKCICTSSAAVFFWSFAKTSLSSFPSPLVDKSGPILLSLTLELLVSLFMELLLVSLLIWLLLVFCLLPLEFLLVGEAALEARVESVECMRDVVSPGWVPLATCGVRRKEKDTFWISQDEHQQMKFRNKINASNSSWGILFIVMSKTKLIVCGKSNLLVPSESTVNSSSSVSHPLQEPILLSPSSLFVLHQPWTQWEVGLTVFDHHLIHTVKNDD